MKSSCLQVFHAEIDRQRDNQRHSATHVDQMAAPIVAFARELHRPSMHQLHCRRQDPTVTSPSSWGRHPTADQEVVPYKIMMARC